MQNHFLYQKKIYQRILFIIVSFYSLLINLKAQTDTILIVNDIQIIGNNTTKDYVILREMTLQKGDTLKQELIDLDKNHIYNLQLFNKVDIEYSVKDSLTILYVIVNERWYFVPYPIFGMRYRDPSKLYYGIGVMHTNFRGRNEKLYASTALGYDRWFLINYQNPKIFNKNDYFYSGTISFQKVHNLSESNGEYENSKIALNSTFGKRFGMYQTLSISFGYQVWQVSEPKFNRTLALNGRDAFFYSSLQYKFDTRNNREYTTDGYLYNLVLTKYGFGESEVNLTSLSYDLKRFFGFNKNSGIGFRTFGSFTCGGNIPIYRRVYFGYSERIRGYFYKTLEAENMVGFNTEIRLPIISPRYIDVNIFNIPEFSKLRYGLYFGIFADAGKIWWRNDSFSKQPIYSGYGAGLHILLPYGVTIRLEGAANNYGKTEGIIDFETSF